MSTIHPSEFQEAPSPPSPIPSTQKERFKSSCSKMMIRGRGLGDAQTFHAGKTRAIGKGKGLVLELQHPLPCLGKQVWTDPSEVDDP